MHRGDERSVCAANLLIPFANSASLFFVSVFLFNHIRRFLRQLDDEARAEQRAREAAPRCAHAELPSGRDCFVGSYEARVSFVEAGVQGCTPEHNALYSYSANVLTLPVFFRSFKPT